MRKLLRDFLPAFVDENVLPETEVVKMRYHVPVPFVTDSVFVMINFSTLRRHPLGNSKP